MLRPAAGDLAGLARAAVLEGQRAEDLDYMAVIALGGPVPVEGIPIEVDGDCLALAYLQAVLLRRGRVALLERYQPAIRRAVNLVLQRRPGGVKGCLATYRANLEPLRGEEVDGGILCQVVSTVTRREHTESAVVLFGDADPCPRGQRAREGQLAVAQVDVGPVLPGLVVLDDNFSADAGVLRAVAEEDAAALLRCGVSDDAAAGERELLVGVYAAAHVARPVVLDGAVFERELALAPVIILVVNAAALLLCGVARDGAAAERRHAVVLDAAALLVARGVVANLDAGRGEGRALGDLDAAAIVVREVIGKGASAHVDGSVV